GAALAISCAALIASVAALTSVVHLATSSRELAPELPTDTRVVRMRGADIPPSILGTRDCSSRAAAIPDFHAAVGLSTEPGIATEVRRFPSTNAPEVIEFVQTDGAVSTRTLLVVEY